MVYSFIYSTSYQTENYTGCQFQRPALRVLLLREMRSLPERGWKASLPALFLAHHLSFINKTKADPEPESLGRSFGGEGKGGSSGGQMWADQKMTSPADWLRI